MIGNCFRINIINIRLIKGIAMNKYMKIELINKQNTGNVEVMLRVNIAFYYIDFF